jgi:hypothetical protein
VLFVRLRRDADLEPLALDVTERARCPVLIVPAVRA